MRILAILTIFAISSSSIIAQVNWYLEPTQESRKFITPPTAHFPNNFIVVLYEDDQTSKLVDNTGKTIVERDSFMWLNSFKLDNTLYFINRYKRKIKYYNQNNKRIDKGYDEVYPDSYFKTLTTKKNGLLGLIDTDGNVMIPNKYKSLKRISTGKFKVIDEDGREQLLSIKDKRNSRGILEYVIKDKKIFRMPGRKGTGIGIIDGKNDTLLHLGRYYSQKILNAPQLILDSLLYVKSVKANKYGLINLRGELVINTIYNSMKMVDSIPFLMNVSMDSTWGVLDLRSNEFNNYGFKRAQQQKNYIHVKNDNLVGLLDVNGKVIFPAEYQEVRVGDSSYILKKNDAFRIFSSKKNQYSDSTFKKIKSIGNKVYLLTKNKLYGLYDGKNLEFITDTIYTNIKKIHNHIECMYSTKDTIFYDPPLVKKNKKGEVIRTYSKRIKTHYNYEYRNLQGDLLYGPIKKQIKNLNKKYGYHHLYEKDTLAIVDFRSFQPHLFPSQGIKIDNEVITIDSSSYILDRFMNPAVQTIPYQALTYNEKSKVFTYKENGKYGFVSKESVLTLPIYQEVEHRSDNIYLVKYNDKYGLLEVGDEKGWWAKNHHKYNILE